MTSAPRDIEVFPLGRRGRFAMTPLQRRAYDALIRHQDEHGCAPTMNALAETLGLPNRGAASRVVDHLVERGWAIRCAGQSRAVILTEPVMRFSRAA